MHKVTDLFDQHHLSLSPAWGCSVRGTFANWMVPLFCVPSLSSVCVCICVWRSASLHVLTLAQRYIMMSCHIVWRTCTVVASSCLNLNYSRLPLCQSGCIYSHWSLPPTLHSNNELSEVTTTNEPILRERRRRQKRQHREMWSICWSCFLEAETEWDIKAREADAQCLLLLEVFFHCPNKENWERLNRKLGWRNSKYPSLQSFTKPFISSRRRWGQTWLFFGLWTICRAEGQPLCQSLGQDDRLEKMDCCPVLVSDLPVLCSRIDGVVTVVKAEQPKSTYLYWGKFLPVYNSLCHSDISTATGKVRWFICSHTACNVQFTIWLSTRKNVVKSICKHIKICALLDVF